MLKNTTLSMRMKIVVGCILGIGSVYVSVHSFGAHLGVLTVGRGSIASIVRYAYINGFTGDDFLCKSTSISELLAQGFPA